MPPAIELATAGTGLALLVAPLVWRVRVRRAASRRLRHAAFDPDPETRRAAIAVMADQGLRPYAGLLIERCTTEADPRVRAALAEAVARNQWEPADSGPLVDLRLWAQRELTPSAAAPEGTVLVQSRPVAAPPAPASPAPASPAPAPAPPLTPPFNGNGNGNGNGAVNGDGAPTRPDRSVYDPRPTSLARRPARLTVMVTGAGGPAGVAIVRALVAAGHRVVAVDADPLAVGLRLAQRSAIVPRTDDPTLVDRLCDLALDMGARALIPTLTEELAVLAEAQTELEEVGLETWLPDPEAVRTCADKWRFAQLMESSRLPGPATNLGTAAGVPGPWVVKPRFGRGSRDVYLADDEAGLEWALAHVPDPIVQTRLVGREFTVDVLADDDGNVLGAVPRWRLETKAGISTKGRTFSNRRLVGIIGELVKALGLTGAANVQGFVGVDRQLSFVEVNPRFSGGLPLSLAAGADLVGEYLRGIFREPIRPERLAYRAGVTMIRHFEELIE